MIGIMVIVNEKSKKSIEEIAKYHEEHPDFY